VFPIPNDLESRYAASMLCAGLTVYSPLKTNGCGPGKKVGVVGIGGLGHYAFTHSPNKVEDAKQLGADHIVNTGDKVSID
jgi:alcohol dehydrogenase (NADP+)